MKNIRVFYLNFFSFLVVKFSVYLNRHVFVMSYSSMLLCFDIFSPFSFILAPRIALCFWYAFLTIVKLFYATSFVF